MTSPVEEVTVECPRCGRVYEDWIRRSVNASLDPDIAADAAYMDEASSVTCPECSEKVRIDTLIAGRFGKLQRGGSPGASRLRAVRVTTADAPKNPRTDT